MDEAVPKRGAFLSELWLSYFPCSCEVNGLSIRSTCSAWKRVPPRHSRRVTIYVLLGAASSAMEWNVTIPER